MDTFKQLVLMCGFLISYICFNNNIKCNNTVNRTICQLWQDAVLDALQESKREKRDTDCLVKFGETFNSGLMRAKRSEPDDHHCLSKSIMKCLFYIDNKYFLNNDTHITGNITVNIEYINDNTSVAFNVSNMVVPLVHSANLTHEHFIERNNTWPWCMPNIPGKQLNIIWHDTLIPSEWLINATPIYVGAFGFEFLDGNNVTQFLSDK
ncbi:protein EE16 [Elephantid betaherpesvirus 1]|uniref:Protein EE16 n=1 Tax=Elephantid herpesvirus 1 TaxID=146015 RepID=M4JX03_ELHV1|nr:protein EE16 [Elephantid betaherpesvirus 1]